MTEMINEKTAHAATGRLLGIAMLSTAALNSVFRRTVLPLYALHSAVSLRNQNWRPGAKKWENTIFTAARTLIPVLLVARALQHWTGRKALNGMQKLTVFGPALLATAFSTTHAVAKANAVDKGYSWHGSHEPWWPTKEKGRF